MGGPVESREEMVAQMAPQLDPTAYCFMIVTPDLAPQALGGAIGTFREDEGVTAIVPEPLARELGEVMHWHPRGSMEVPGRCGDRWVPDNWRAIQGIEERRKVAQTVGHNVNHPIGGIAFLLNTAAHTNQAGA